MYVRLSESPECISVFIHQDCGSQYEDEDDSDDIAGEWYDTDWCLLCKAQDPTQTHPLIHSQNHKIAQLFETKHVQVHQQRLKGGRTGSWAKIAENRIDQEVWEAGRVVD